MKPCSTTDYMHMKKTHDVVVSIAKNRYKKTPKHMYFSGGSTGGREGLTAAMRWPKVYDGILTNYPSANFMGLRLWGVELAHAIYDNDSEGWIPPSMVDSIAKTAMERCDPLDGLVDGVVSNMTGGRELSSQLVADLACENAETGYPPNCLTAAQIEKTLAVYHDGFSVPYSFANDIDTYPGYNSLEGITMGVGSQLEWINEDKLNAHHAWRADQFVKYLVTGDPNFSVLDFDIHNPGVWEDRITELSAMIDATDPDLKQFMVHGGKILWVQGNDDPSVSPYANENVYKSIVAKMGQEKADSFMRFYLAPGLAHGGGVFSPTWDNLTLLDNWVENGVAPTAPVVFDATNTATNGRSLPLCAYPTWPKYVGSGDPNVASSFRCVSE